MKKTNQNNVSKAPENYGFKGSYRDEVELETCSNDNFVSHNRLVKNLKKIFKKGDSLYISHCNAMGLLELVKIKKVLNYKDLRSVVDWCGKNNVFILRHGNNQFVNQWEFILSFYKPFITHLERKHKNWKELFLNYLNGELGQLLTTQTENISAKGSGKYKPKTKKQVSFLDKIKKI